MKPKITVKKDYILVEPNEVEYWEIWEGIATELKLDKFPEKNDIWVFHEGPVNLKYIDLFKLKDFIEENYPENASRTKTALVVVTGIQKAMAEFFINAAENLPFEIRVFTHLKLAEDWVKRY